MTEQQYHSNLCSFLSLQSSQFITSFFLYSHQVSFLYYEIIKEVSLEGTDGAQGRLPRGVYYYLACGLIQTENKQGPKDSGRTSDCPSNCLETFR